MSESKMLPSKTGRKIVIEIFKNAKNVVFLIQQLTTTVSYGFNDIKTTLTAVVEENRILKLKLKLSLRTLTLLLQLLLLLDFFATNFYPERKKPAPRTKDTRSGCTDRPAPFSWKHFRKLIDEVRGSEYEQLNDDLFYACKLNVSAQFVKAVIDDAEIELLQRLEKLSKRTHRKVTYFNTKRQYGIPGDAQLYAIESLETKAALYIPLRSCVGSWEQTCFLSITGATSVDRVRCSLLLMVHWHFIPNYRLCSLDEPSKIAILSDIASRAFIYGQRNLEQRMGSLAVRQEKCSNPRGGNAKDDFVFSLVVITNSVIDKRLARTGRALQKELTVAGIRLNLSNYSFKGALLFLVELTVHTVKLL
ncbi:hypothetical protein BCV71DRAFT_236580 [Rhizopus microsporus]|uniref:Uncharacterized protein n=1 Tax=Rhizopus microsporus TaxID=58291 RepID=A0A1X0RXD9_RHIZD|nr:hypothetical protein BCV71DRAFT_236580 [Rhizopus microsporus]